MLYMIAMFSDMILYVLFSYINVVYRNNHNIETILSHSILDNVRFSNAICTPKNI